MTDQGPLQTAPTISTLELEQEKSVLAQKRKPTQDAGETIGQRLARFRRERGMTQVELADRLGVAQPVVSDYERSELRLHGELIVKLTQILSVSAEELLGLEKPKPNQTLKNRRLLRRLQEIDRLPRRDLQALLRTIDNFLRASRLG
jgi:transcriptional regulator with XRE-family HTH domain